MCFVLRKTLSLFNEKTIEYFGTKEVSKQQFCCTLILIRPSLLAS